MYALFEQWVEMVIKTTFALSAISVGVAIVCATIFGLIYSCSWLIDELQYRRALRRSKRGEG